MKQSMRIVRRAVPQVRDEDWPEQLPPLLRRLYAARGATSPMLAQPRLTQLHAPTGLSNLESAVDLLASAIVQQQRILVVGDFDCDGATACAVAVRGLRMLGATDVRHAVPNRIIHGYGLSPALVAELAPLQPQLLLTVDHGVACHAGVAAAKALGWQVVVSDHHLPGEWLPPADAIVDPNLHGDSFPSKALAGVGVVFYLLMALRARLFASPRDTAAGSGSGSAQRPDLASLLDLVAVGTVADLVPLDLNNRALVAAGLRRLRQGQGCVGLRALIEISGREPSRLSASDIGFALGPRLNAAGRLEDMALGIELLLTENPTRARTIAAMLEEINAERRAVQQLMTDDAEAALASVVLAEHGEPPLLACLFDPQWHPGVVGLVASKMKDRLHRPVIAFAPAEPGGELLRGSARSIPGLHIRDLLAAVDALQPGLIEKFGGHAMAAGLSLARSALPEFERLLVEQLRLILDPSLLQAELISDGELAVEEFDYVHAEALRLSGPWGQGFAEPLFDGEFEVLHWRVLKDRHLKLSLRHPRRAAPLNAIYFNGWQGIEPARQVHIAYRLACDDYRGGEAIQLLVEYCAPATEAAETAARRSATVLAAPAGQ